MIYGEDIEILDVKEHDIATSSIKATTNSLAVDMENSGVHIDKIGLDV